jgi:hypothetical protein
VRYLSLHDLCAMTAMQYEHAGLGALWRLIEAALLAPAQEEWLELADEPLACWRNGEVLIAEPDAPEAAHAPPHSRDASFDSPDRAAAQLRRRQFEAVLAAHGLTLRCVPVDADRNPRAVLATV